MIYKIKIRKRSILILILISLVFIFAETDSIRNGDIRPYAGRLFVSMLFFFLYYRTSVIKVNNYGVWIRKIIFIRARWIRDIHFINDELLLSVNYFWFKVRIPLAVDNREEMLKQIASILSAELALKIKNKLTQHGES